MGLILIFLLILLLIPIKIKFLFLYNNNNLEVRLSIFNKIFYLSSSWQKYVKSVIYNFKFKEHKRKYNGKLTNKLNNLNKKKLIYSLINNPFKPKLHSEISMAYNIENMAIEAISFGYIYQVLDLIHNYLSLIFNYKIDNQQIKPLFKEENYLYFSFESILYVNFAKTIYMLFLILKSFNKGEKKVGK